MLGCGRSGLLGLGGGFVAGSLLSRLLARPRYGEGMVAIAYDANHEHRMLLHRTDHERTWEAVSKMKHTRVIVLDMESSRHDGYLSEGYVELAQSTLDVE